MIIGSDVIIEIEDFLRIVIDNHLYGYRQEMNDEEIKEEIIYMWEQNFKSLGMILKDINITKKKEIKLTVQVNGKILKIIL